MSPASGPGDQSFPLVLRLFITSDVPVLGGLLSDRAAAGAADVGQSGILPVWHGVELTRGLIINNGLTASAAARSCGGPGRLHRRRHRGRHPHVHQGAGLMTGLRHVGS